MMRQHSVARRIGDRERERLGKLFRSLGSDNVHEAEAARAAIDGLLRQFGKSWSDLIQLLGGSPAAIHADLARDIPALGSHHPDERAQARRNIADLLARHRKNWNDLTDELCASSPASWACNAAADPPRVPNLLGLIVFLLKEYVELREHEYVAVALWALHTHVYSNFMVTPRLALRSPTAGCGKTVLLDVMTRLVARADKFDSISTAAIFRLIDETHCTLLIDEADNLGVALGPNGRLRAVFNSGHRNGGSVAILEQGTTRRYSTFAPLALALPDMFGGLPRTLASRCIEIRMERNSGQRELLRFDINHPDPALDQAYEQILLWRRSLALGEVELTELEMPAGTRNRLRDNWRGLLSVADSLGWGTEARQAMLAFAREFRDADIKIVLLEDCRKVFDLHQVDRLLTKGLLAALHALDGAEWCEFRGLRGDQQPHRLKDTEMAAALREFKIRPKTIWPLARSSESKSGKGYLASQFEEAWSKYCADDGTAAHASNVKSLRAAGGGTGMLCFQKPSERPRVPYQGS